MAMRAAISAAMAEQSRLKAEAASTRYCNAALEDALAAADAPLQAALEATNAAAARERAALLQKAEQARSELKSEAAAIQARESKREWGSVHGP